MKPEWPKRLDFMRMYTEDIQYKTGEKLSCSYFEIICPGNKLNMAKSTIFPVLATENPIFSSCSVEHKIWRYKTIFTTLFRGN